MKRHFLFKIKSFYAARSYIATKIMTKPQTRETVIQHYQANPKVSVLVIGGGVNGIGVFRELALQGVDVLLVEKNDFCSGTSAASSHMAHGGLRYLENGEFRLVREAVAERNRLLANAPHYVKPLPTAVPVFSMFSGLWNAPLKFLGLLEKPAQRGAVVIKLGLLLYDYFTGTDRVVPAHKFLSKQRGLELIRGIAPALKYLAVYYDGAILSPERLCVEMLLDGEAYSANAKALNYVELAGTNGHEVLLKDSLSGVEIKVEPQLVINAAGPWIDRANQILGHKTEFIGATKGSHLILDHPALRKAIGEHEVFFENQDGRIVLIYPYFDKVLVGTSDIPVAKPDDLLCTEEEIAYFFDMVKYIFPEISMNRDQIVFQFSGARPLPKSDASLPGQISRDHQIKVSLPDDNYSFPVLSLVGGKWTSFRAFAEQTVDRALAILKKERTAVTKNLAVGGGKDYPSESGEYQAWVAKQAQDYDLPIHVVESLFQRYGSYAARIFPLVNPEENFREPVLQKYFPGEIAFLAAVEKVIHMEDLVLRRTHMAKLGEIDLAGINELAGFLGEKLGWDADRRAAEIDRLVGTLKNRHGLAL